jgi:hypothetical protein
MKLRKLGWVLVGLLLAVVAILVVAVLYADRLTKVGVETAGTQALGVETQLQSANLSLLGGSLRLEGLKVANPTGYETPTLVTVGECYTGVNVKSLLTDTIEVKTIRVENLVVTVEQKGLTSNLETVLKQIQKTSEEAPPGPGQKQPEGAPQGGGTKVVVDRIEIVNASARLKLLPLPGQADVVEVKLAPIVLENVSPERNKAELMATVFREVLLAVANGVVQAGGEQLPASLREGLGNSIKGLEKVVGGVTVKAGEVLKEKGKVLEEGGKVLDKVGKDILSLPGKKK